MSRPLHLLCLGLLAGCITELPEVDQPCAAWEESGLFKYTLEHDGKTRKAYVFVPEDSVGPRDMVMAFHGAGNSARAMSEMTGHIELAREEGFVAVFPQGTHPIGSRYAWNAGDCCNTAKEEIRDVDDFGYIEKLSVQLQKRTCSDRILATGFSNGGMFAHRWACASDQVDAVVSVAGPLMWDGGCEGRPIPMRHYHGVDDNIVPIAGSKELGLLPVRQQLRPWMSRNACETGTPAAYEKLGPMTCEALACAAPTEVCLIQEWKHLWPGGIFADQLDGVDATVQGWEFFLDNVGEKPITTPTGTTGTGTTDTGGAG